MTPWTELNMTKKNKPILHLARVLAAGTLACAAGFAAVPEARAACTCFNFESLTAGTSFSVGDRVNIAPGQVRFVPLLPSGTSGTATIVTSNFAGGSSFQELNLNNIGMRLVLDDTVPTAKFLYDDHGGRTNLEVNGDVRVLNDLCDVGPNCTATVGGATVEVTETAIAGGLRGGVTITGEIDSFGVGGQEFHIDDVCVDC